MRKRVALACCLLAFARPGAGQDIVPTRLTLAEALSLAAERNPEFAAARNAIEIAEADRQQAARRPNPALTVDSAGYPRLEPNPPIATEQGSSELTVRFDQELALRGRRRLRIEAAEAGIDQARFASRNRLRQLELAVKRAYMQAALAAADRAVAQASLEEIDKVLGVTRARFDEGEISGAEFRRLQVERLRFVDDVFAAELAFRNARSELLALLGAADLTQQIEIAEPLAPPPAGGAPLGVAPPAVERSTLVARALEARPDVLAARQEVRRAESETRLQRALRAPNPTVGAGYRRDFGANALVFGVTIPVPLFNSLNAGGVERAAAELRRAANEAAAAELTVRLNVQQASNAVDINRERIAYIEREYLTPARESREIVLASYRLGAVNLIDFLDAQRAYRDTVRTYNRALYEGRISTFELEAAVGGSEPPGVTRND